MINIKVSSLDPESENVFNKEVGRGQLSQVTEASIYLNSYSVSDSGAIFFPILGQIKVAGKEIMEIKAMIEEKLEEYYKLVVVDAKVVNFKITVLGEVNSQGSYSIYRPQANIIQAIGMAGGITDLGNKSKVSIIRKLNNESYTSYIDLTSVNFINSPYYYLQPNDIIYIEPLKAKFLRVNSASIQIGISAITLLFVVFNTLSRF